MIDNLGPCCACRRSEPPARNIIMIERKAPTPGRGWGCVVCGLGCDGAIAVLCDECVGDGRSPVEVCAGYPAEDPGRVPVDELAGEHVHNERAHHVAEQRIAGSRGLQ